MNVPFLVTFAVVSAFLSVSVCAEERFVEIASIPSAHAHQAAAADTQFLYAIGSESIAKIDRATGQELAVSTGKAKHLNSGFLWQGKLYCAHSNYPRKPEKSEIMVLNPETMALSQFKDFGEYRGSLTWVVREGDFWWCNFARYGAENDQTVLVKLDDNWKEQGAWTYPPEVVREIGRHSISGGVWRKGELLVTGHDHRVLYRLRLPTEGTILEFVSAVPAPFPGQGIATDSVSGGLVGIDRAKKRIIIAHQGEQPHAEK